MHTLDLLIVMHRNKLQKLRREAETHRMCKRPSPPRLAPSQISSPSVWVGQHPQKPLEPLS